MQNILVINGHPTYGQSFSNKIIVDELRGAFAESLEIHELAKDYPNYVIDVVKEQRALERADVVILEFPFFWYSVPAILKKWIDDVLVYGFAYGPGGDKVKGKKLLFSFTTGGDDAAYTKEGHNGHSVAEMTTPLLAIARFVNMHADTVYTTGVLYSQEKENEIKTRITKHAQKLIELCRV